VLPQRYVMLGFKLFELGEESLVIKYKNNILFVLGGGLDTREDFLGKLCEAHLDVAYP
jgi:hypothetical protein